MRASDGKLGKLFGGKNKSKGEREVGRKRERLYDGVISDKRPSHDVFSLENKEL